MAYSVHKEHHGDGAYKMESLMALAFVILAPSPEEADSIAAAFNDGIDQLLTRFPQIRGELSMEDCRRCFERAIAISEREEAA